MEQEQRDKKYMQMAIEEAKTGILKNDGGPFGTVIVKDGEVIGTGHNRGLANNDPTAHGEIEAIRAAGRRLKSFNLQGATLYTTGEPCHMCLCACMWANIEKVYYGCTIEDNGLIGFRDDKFDKIFGGRDKLEGYMTEVERQKCLELFQLYRSLKRERY